ncbi:M28 family peptidase [Stieleria sp. TO1_6]|uniref:M28 family peptidase n=1 Tax=Stieleria tagensis TaxID=2956795 RepID=UPI00209A7060|nr:M28 family peptidase [Stieleria tagensis]MCO8120227.1 M28 family peptidase [Stieleria tagensis]
MKTSVSIGLATLALFLSIGYGWFQYRGPTPLGIDAPPHQPAAARMRQTLVDLLGTPPQSHVTGTAGGEAFLKRLETKIQSFGLATQRIEIPWDPATIEYFPTGQIDLLPKGSLLNNLLVTISGRDPSLAPLLVATHHDSCRWGPGAGDAGSAVVALVEHIRILSLRQPQRTVHYLFTDGEEFGLLGANAIAAENPRPFRDPFFVLNFDARGTSGGVPMFETATMNNAWIGALVNHLARPKITSSLAVTVYRSLPNATDFHVFQGKLGWAGFNFATIGSAHHYHQPSDRPENISDRTLQHMGDHLFRMHQAFDAIDAEQAQKIRQQNQQHPANAVFFDLFGSVVIHFSETNQLILAICAAALLAGCLIRYRRPQWFGMFAGTMLKNLIAIVGGSLVGWAAHFILATTPWVQLRYTPVDLPAGLLTLAISFLVATWILERQRGSSATATDSGDVGSDWIWCLNGLLGLILAIVLPGGAYLLILPSLAYAAVRLTTGHRIASASCGWTVAVVITGPLLVLLVQSLGPWHQPMYATISGLLAVLAMTTWNRNSQASRRTLDRRSDPRH